MVQVPNSIFREYDIRGIAGEEFSQEEIVKYEKWYGPFPGVTLTKEVARAIGRAYGSLIRREGGNKVVVGYERRPFGKELQNAFMEGVLASGCGVVDAGVTLTPFIYFAVAHFGFDGGVNITGSHNVYFYNGFKMMKKGVWPLFGTQIQELYRIVRDETWDTGEGVSETVDVYGAYEAYVLSHVKLKRPLKVVVDTGNGSAGTFAPGLLRKLGCEVVELYTEPDATFPNHDPDPEAPQNMKDAGEAVRTAKADFGIGLDADGDRAGFVDEAGNFVSADLPLLVFAKDVLTRHPGKKIVYDVKCSQLVRELVPGYGGVPVMHKTGHAPIKQTLRQQQDVIFAGEVSGHFYFVEDYFQIDDGIFAACKMAELVSGTSGAFSSLFAGIPKRVRTPEIKLACEDEKKFGVVEQIADNFRQKFSVVLIDGVRIQVTLKGWGLIRASNTSPYLTIRVEGENEQEVLEIKKILAQELKKFPAVQETLDTGHVASFTGKLGWR